jgi:hypothetical protein
VVARSAVLRGGSAVVRSRRVAQCVGAVVAHPLGPRLAARKTIGQRHIERQVVPVRSALCRKVSGDATDGNLLAGARGSSFGNCTKDEPDSDRNGGHHDPADERV